MTDKRVRMMATGIVLIAVTGCVGAVFAEDSYYLEKVWNTPDYTQTDLAYGGLPDPNPPYAQHGGYFCGPTSASNSLMWLDDHGYSNLVANTSDRKRDQHDLLAAIAGADYMNAYETDGVGITYFCKGVKDWVHEAGYEYERLLFQGYCTCDAEFYAGTQYPDLNWARAAIRDPWSVAILNVGWFAYDPATDNYDEVGGHYMTMVGYGHDGTNYDPNYLIAHDPAPRAGTTFANNYALPVMITSGTLNGNRNAAGYYKLTDGIVVPSKADFCILRGVIVLEMVPVDTPPVAVGDAYNGTEDSALTIQAARGVLINDTDADGNPLDACLLSNPSHGAVSLDASGSFVYTPAANYHGLDSFIYRAFDGYAYSNPATVNLDVVSVNDAPIAVDDAYEVLQGSPRITYNWEGLLVNDTDVDELDGDMVDDFNFTTPVQSGPAHGTLEMWAAGAFKYTPASGFCGTDSFTYKTFDGEAYSELATVLIRVLSAVEIPGDANRDGTIDAADATILAENWGKPVSGGARMGDFDADGTVGPADAAILAANWGRLAEGAAAVPEPGMIASLLFLTAMASCRRQRPGSPCRSLTVAVR